VKGTLIASFVALAGLTAGAPSQAMPFAPPQEAGAGLTLVAYGCGYGWTRGPYGRCHPMGYFAAPRPAYGFYAYRPSPRPYIYAPRCWWRGGVRVCA
jgi:hypothetical protein